jgi:hypothetical protein
MLGLVSLVENRWGAEEEDIIGVVDEGLDAEDEVGVLSQFPNSDWQPVPG